MAFLSPFLIFCAFRMEVVLFDFYFSQTMQKPKEEKTANGKIQFLSRQSASGNAIFFRPCTSRKAGEVVSSIRQIDCEQSLKRISYILLFSYSLICPGFARLTVVSLQFCFLSICDASVISPPNGPVANRLDCNE